MKPSVGLAAIFLLCKVHAAPFPTTDQNPFLTGFGLPKPYTARIAAHDTAIATTLNWSNVELAQQSASEFLIADAESQEWRFAVEHAWTDKFAVRLDVPYRKIGGGSLDHFIEQWHSLFGMPNGKRDLLPRDVYRIDYERNGSTLASFDESASGLGDVALAMGYQMVASKEAALSLWGSLKFPTGDSGKLLGSGAYSAALGIAQEYILSHRWSLIGQVNGVYLGRGDLLSSQQRNYVISGFVGVEYHYSAALSLALQLDAHSAAFNDTSLDLLGSAWILTFGGEYRFAKDWRAQLGVSEDVKVDASPDVTFVMSVTKSWK